MNMCTHEIHPDTWKSCLTCFQFIYPPAGKSLMFFICRYSSLFPFNAEVEVCIAEQCAIEVKAVLDQSSLNNLLLQTQCSKSCKDSKNQDWERPKDGVSMFSIHMCLGGACVLVQCCEQLIPSDPGCCSRALPGLKTIVLLQNSESSVSSRNCKREKKPHVFASKSAWK